MILMLFFGLSNTEHFFVIGNFFMVENLVEESIEEFIINALMLRIFRKVNKIWQVLKYH